MTSSAEAFTTNDVTVERSNDVSVGSVQSQQLEESRDDTRHNTTVTQDEKVATLPPGSLNWSASIADGRRKIVPSSDLLEDCYTSDGTTTSDAGSDVVVGRRTTAARLRTRDDEGGRFWSSTSVDKESLKTPDSLLTSELLDDSIFDGELDLIDSRPSSATDKLASDRLHAASADTAPLWSTVTISDKEYKIDLKVIEPYKRVLSHGGYYGDGYNTIIVITACYLPDNRRHDYHYVMRNLFLYVISSLELLVTDDYVIIYFHGAAPRNKMPSFRWLRHCYGMIDRRYKKRLKKLLIVHPTFFLRTVVLMTRPFISSKFYSKLHYVHRLDELRHLVPMDHVFICNEVKRYDASRIQQQHKKSSIS